MNSYKVEIKVAGHSVFLVLEDVDALGAQAQALTITRQMCVVRDVQRIS